MTPKPVTEPVPRQSFGQSGLGVSFVAPRTTDLRLLAAESETATRIATPRMSTAAKAVARRSVVVCGFAGIKSPKHVRARNVAPRAGLVTSLGSLHDGGGGC